jgi:molybdopterin-guanine dinucleotide biosynthesis protein A
MTIPCTGVILSGGLNTRFSGKDKSFIRLGNTCILDLIYSIFKDLFDEIILVTNSPMDYIHLDATIVTDIYPVRSSLTGIHTGLYYASNDYSFFIACDTPFLNKMLIETIIDQIDAGVDAIVPETSNGIEPLFAVYSKNCLHTIEHQLNQKHLKVKKFLKKIRTKFLPEIKIKEVDPDLNSFFNINTPEDLAIAKKLVKTYTNK